MFNERRRIRNKEQSQTVRRAIFPFPQVQHYILVVQATDGGAPALSSTVTVYCNVVDLNDNAPIFETGPHIADLMENATVGTAVLAVAAQDLDSGDNGRIAYAVAGGDEDSDFGVAANGTLFTRRPLDRERKPVYNLMLSATDCPLPPARPLSSVVQVSEVPVGKPRRERRIRRSSRSTKREYRSRFIKNWGIARKSLS